MSTGKDSNENSKQIINLTVINENESTSKPQRRKKLSNDLIKQFKQHLLSKDFFARLRDIMLDIDCELQMTRNGGAVSDDYIELRKDKEQGCADPTRVLVTYNDDFK